MKCRRYRRCKRSGVEPVAIFASLVAVSAIHLGAIGAVIRPQDNPGPGTQTQLDPNVADQLGLNAGELVVLELPDQSAERVTVPIRLGGEAFTLMLRRYSQRSEDFRLWVQDQTGDLREVQPPEVTTYRGIIPQQPGSRVAASIVGGRMTASIHLDQNSWFVQPLSDAIEAAPAALHAVYSAADQRHGDWTCGTDDDMRSNTEPVAAKQNPGDGAEDGGDQAVLIAIDADFEFFDENNRNVGDTVADIEQIMNGVNVIYRRDVNIGHVVTAIVIRTAEPDPYTSTNPNNLLCQFRATWNSAPEVSIQRDVAHLFTGKDIDGTTIGLAWTGVMCNVVSSDGSGTCTNVANLAYGLSESTFSGNLNQRVALTAHEIGHNWNAVHCDGDSDCNIMCSDNGCTGNITNFGTRAVNAITAFRNAAACPRPMPSNVVYVSLTNNGDEDGSLTRPFNTFTEAAAAVAPGGWVVFLHNGPYDETLVVDTAMKLITPRGTVVIGE